MKNLKMFAISLLAFLVMVSGVRAAEENPCKEATGKTAVYAKINGTAACYKDISAVLTAAKAEENGAEEGSTVEITLYEDITSETAKLELTEGVNYVIDLNGKDLTLNDKVITVANAQSLTIKGKGEITASAALITVPATAEGSKVTVEKDVTMTVSGTTGAILVAGANELNLAGTLKYTGSTKDAVVVTGGDDAPAVNMSGNIDSKMNGITVTDGAATINVTGGSIKAAETGKYAISLDTKDEDSLPILKISGGEFTVKSGSAAVSFGENNAKAILDANKGNVTGGVFKYGLVKGIKVNDGDMTVADIIAVLVGDADYELAKNGTVTVTAKAPVVDPGTQTPGTTEPSTDLPPVPQTYDNILVYAGLGLVSAISVGFAAKRKENN